VNGTLVVGEGGTPVYTTSLTVNGAENITGNLILAGSAYISGGSTVSGNAQLYGDTTVGTTSTNRNLTVNGNTTLSGTTTAGAINGLTMSQNSTAITLHTANGDVVLPYGTYQPIIIPGDGGN
jgi:hypothetical protein